MKLRHRRVAVFGGTVVAGALALASLAFACTPPAGQTRWSNTGTGALQSHPQGAVVRLFATSASASSPHVLAIGTTDSGHSMNHTCMDIAGYINPNVVFSNSFGTIPHVQGTIPNVPDGSYQVCFRDPDTLNNSYSTGAALLTII